MVWLASALFAFTFLVLEPASAVTFRPVAETGDSAGLFSMGPSVLPKPQDGTPLLDLLPQDRGAFELGVVVPQGAPSNPALAPTAPAAVVPLPSSAVLMVTALGAISLWRRRLRAR
jgi:hypothetical protein